MSDVVEYLKDLTKLAERGEAKGIVVYITKGRNAHYGVVGDVGLDDFSILSIRASISASECLRSMEADAASTRQ